MPHTRRLLFTEHFIGKTNLAEVIHIFLALADSGSPSCFLTESAAQLLCAPCSKTFQNMVGLSKMPTLSQGFTSLSTLNSYLVIIVMYLFFCQRLKDDKSL